VVQNKKSMKKTSSYILLLGLLFLLSCNAEQETKGVTQTTAPNIIFILADDMSYRDLSCYGQKRYQTPHLDALAATGIRFNQAYAAAPECAPSRGCLMTGLHTGNGPIRVKKSDRGQDNMRAEYQTIDEH